MLSLRNIYVNFMAKRQGYTEDELKQLHSILHEILAEIARVCELLHIQYFITGGTVIGAKFWKDIIAWDDDIDIGMKRENYNRFLKEAPQVLKKDFFLQWFGSDPHTPFYFAKVRKSNTVFQEEISRDIKMHQGVYIDIFPFDKVPDNTGVRRWQRKTALFLNSCFVCKEIWPYKYFGKCSIDGPWKESVFHVFIKKITSCILSKKTIYNLMLKVKNSYNGKQTKFYGQVMMKSEFIPSDEIDKTSMVKFGDLTVEAPFDIDAYLTRHYGKVEKFPPMEMRVTHRPVKLSL